MTTAHARVVSLRRDARPEQDASVTTHAPSGEATAAQQPPEVPFSLVLVRPSGGVVLWAGKLTPYLTQTIIRHALLAGRGSHVFVTLTRDASDEEVEAVTRRLASLRGRGTRVTVSRGVEATLRRLTGRSPRPDSEPPTAA